MYALYFLINLYISLKTFIKFTLKGRRNKILDDAIMSTTEVRNIKEHINFGNRERKDSGKGVVQVTCKVHPPVLHLWN